MHMHVSGQGVWELHSVEVNKYSSFNTLPQLCLISIASVVKRRMGNPWFNKF